MGDLTVADRTTKIVKEILALEKTADYTLSGKTGAGMVAENRALGWFVGYLNPRKNTPSIALAWMEMNFASWALRPRLTVFKTLPYLM